MTATAAVQGVVLDRRKVSFESTNRESGEPETVTYFEAYLYDPTTRDIAIVRSTDQADIEPLVPGATHSFEGRPGDKPGMIRCPVVKPSRGDASDGRF